MNNLQLEMDLSKIKNIDFNEDKLFIKYNKNKSVLRIPRFLKIDDDFLRVIYLLYGDGNIGSKIMFANINYRAHKKFIETFRDSLNIKPDVWKLAIIVNDNFSKKNINNSIDFWVNSLIVNEVRYVYKTSFNTCAQGVARTYFNNVKLSNLLNLIINRLNKKIMNVKLNKKHLCVILDGILNAEGGARIDNIGIHKITIAFNKYNTEEKELFKKILDSLELGTYKISQERRFEFSNWINCYKFLRVFVMENVKPFSINPHRAKNLFQGFLNHQRTQSVYKYLNVISKRKKQTLKEINRELKYHTTSIEEALIRKFKKFGFFILEGKGIRGTPYKVSISEEGKAFLKVIHKTKKWLKETKRDCKEDEQLLSPLQTS